MATYDCEPALNDTQVFEFCSQGFMVLEAVVPPEIDTRTLEYLDAYYATQDPDLPERTATIPTDIFAEDWFMDNVVLHPQVAGAIRALLGKNFTLPDFLSNHRIKCPMPALVPGRSDHRWHRDGASGVNVPNLERVDFSLEHWMDGAQNCLQVFYYPQDVPLDLGPTELVPSSHLAGGKGQYDLDLLGGLVDEDGNIPSSHLQGAPAGSVTITCYPIWHRRTGSTAEGTRNNLKYRYSRTVPPQRDWTTEPGFEMPLTDPQADGESPADMFAWMCGKPMSAGA